MDSVVRHALEAVERRDWERLKPLLDPYVHWSDVTGVRRGRTNVLAHLLTASPASAPDGYELRDGQIYRWAGSGSGQSSSA